MLDVLYVVSVPSRLMTQYCLKCFPVGPLYAYTAIFGKYKADSEDVYRSEHNEEPIYDGWNGIV